MQKKKKKKITHENSVVNINMIFFVIHSIAAFYNTKIVINTKDIKSHTMNVTYTPF